MACFQNLDNLQLSLLGISCISVSMHLMQSIQHSICGQLVFNLRCWLKIGEFTVVQSGVPVYIVYLSLAAAPDDARRSGLSATFKIPVLLHACQGIWWWVTLSCLPEPPQLPSRLGAAEPPSAVLTGPACSRLGVRPLLGCASWVGNCSVSASYVRLIVRVRL